MMGMDGLKGIKRTSTFCDQSRDVVVECEGVTDTYTKYVYFINPFDTGSGRGIGKGFIPSWEMSNHFL